MGGIFGVVSNDNCIRDLFYGTDYHSHLGTRRGGMTLWNGREFRRVIHNIENTQFRSKFEDDVLKLEGHMGIGVISDTDDQPILIGSHLGHFSIVTVARINNISQLTKDAFGSRKIHFAEMGNGEINPTELFATLINEEASYEEGIQRAQEAIDGSCTTLLLTKKGLYAARDRYGRTPLIIGERNGAYCASSETCAFPNLGYRFKYELGPGEVVFMSPDGIETKMPSGEVTRICGFLWVYYGYPSSSYEGVNVEAVRYRCGAALARNDRVTVDLVAGIPDSGTAHAIGYANEARAMFSRPFVKYTPTWPRSFMPQNQDIRDLVAKMKLIPIRQLIEGKRLLFCEDSIVRGTQLKETIQRLFEAGAAEVHMRPACPPLIFGCRYLNFSISRSELDLAGRRSIHEIEKKDKVSLEKYIDPESDHHQAMVHRIKERLNLTSLEYQKLADLVEAIGLPKEKVCTYCWDGNG